MAVSMTEAMGKGVGLVNMIGGSPERFVEKATSQKELAKTEISDKIEVQKTIDSEMKSLQGLLVQIKKTADVLMNEDTSAFSQKTSSVRTTDVGGFDDYIKDVRVDSKAHNGSIKIKVEQVATRSQCLIGDKNGVGFHKTDPLGIYGIIRLNLNHGANINVAVAPNQTLDQVLANIKGALVNNGDTHEAFSVAGNNDTSCIEIRSKKTGANNDILFGFTDNADWANIHLFVNNVRKNSIEGVDARVSIDGQVRTQSSNEFIDARPGVSFTVLEVNSADQCNTIEVQEDKSKARQMIIEFSNTLDKLSQFIAKNDRTSRSHLNDKYADPYAELKSYNSEESPLRGNVVIEEAKLLWEKFTSKQTHKTGDITSIYDIGMELKSKTRKEDGVTFDSLVFEDEAKFDKLLAEKFEDVRALFVTSAKVTPQAGNIEQNVGEVQYVPTSSSKPIVSALNGDVNISVKYVDGVVNATNFTITLANGTNVAATDSKLYTNGDRPYYMVSFKDTPLEGLKFAVYPKGANAQNDHFTINYSAGLANIIRSDANSMFGEGGFSGSTIDASKDVASKKERLEKELTKITKELDDMTKKLEGQFEQIAMMDVMAGIQQAMIEKMFETS